MEGIRRELPPAPTPHRPTTCTGACPPLALDEPSVILRPVHRSPVLYVPSPSLLEGITPAVLPSPAASYFLSPWVVSKAHKHSVIFPVLKNPSLDPINPCKTKSDVVTPAQNPFMAALSLRQRPNSYKDPSLDRTSDFTLCAPASLVASLILAHQTCS